MQTIISRFHQLMTPPSHLSKYDNKPMPEPSKDVNRYRWAYPVKCDSRRSRFNADIGMGL